MSLRDQLHEQMRQIIETYQLALHNTLMLPGGAPQEQWDELRRAMQSAMQWADLISAEKIRYAGIGERLRLPRAYTPTYHEILDVNPWAEKHTEMSRPVINWRAEHTARLERQYLEGAAQLSKYAGVPVDKIESVVPWYRLDRFKRDAIADVANTAEQIQLAVPEIGGQFPYTLLNSREDARVRPTHALADGLLAPRIHSIWTVIRPPNGFGCRCYVINLSRRESIRRGLMLPSGKMVLTDVQWPSPAAERAYNAGRPYHGADYTEVPRPAARTMFPDAGWTGPKAVGGVNIGVAA